MRTRFDRWALGLRSLLLGATVVLAAGSVVLAQESDRPREKAGAPSAGETRAAADAPAARMMALISSTGAIIQSKGVHSVKRTAVGVYCIRPKNSTGIDPQTAMAVVSVEYYYSRFNEVQVQWARRGSGCGANWFGVYTLADKNLNGIYSFSNAVGFVIFVP